MKRIRFYPQLSSLFYPGFSKNRTLYVTSLQRLRTYFASTWKARLEKCKKLFKRGSINWNLQYSENLVGIVWLLVRLFEGNNNSPLAFNSVKKRTWKCGNADHECFKGIETCQLGYWIRFKLKNLTIESRLFTCYFQYYSLDYSKHNL